MEYKALQFKSDDVNESSRTFAGYASTWDEDLGGDIISKGAFNKTMERKDRIKVLWQHNEPIGKSLNMSTDSKGLFVEGQISKTRLGDEAIELMKDGVIDQMSIGFSIPHGKSEYNEKGNRLNQVRAKLCAKSVINECDGAQYENGDIGLMNTHFDIIWEEVYGYHPIEAADWEKGFNGVIE